MKRTTFQAKLSQLVSNLEKLLVVSDNNQVSDIDTSDDISPLLQDAIASLKLAVTYAGPSVSFTVGKPDDVN